VNRYNITVFLYQIPRRSLGHWINSVDVTECLCIKGVTMQFGLIMHQPISGCAMYIIDGRQAPMH